MLSRQLGTVISLNALATEVDISLIFYYQVLAPKFMCNNQKRELHDISRLELKEFYKYAASIDCSSRVTLF